MSNAHLALPLLIPSHRSANDRRFVNTKTVEQCENNPKEIDYLLRNIPEEELSLLHLYTIDDLKLTYQGYYDMGVAWFEKCVRAQKVSVGRWNLDGPVMFYKKGE